MSISLTCPRRKHPHGQRENGTGKLVLVSQLVRGRAGPVRSLAHPLLEVGKEAGTQIWLEMGTVGEVARLTVGTPKVVAGGFSKSSCLG